MGLLSQMDSWGAEMAASFRRTDLFKALPFYASVITMLSCYPVFLAPMYLGFMYFASFDMSVNQYRHIIPAATIGTFVTFLPGELAKQAGARAVLIVATAFTIVVYGYAAYAYHVGDLVYGEGLGVVLLAFMIGQCAGWLKIASLASTFATVHPDALGRAFGFVLGAFEAANFFYALLTEVWTTDVFFMDDIDTSTVKIMARRVLIPIVAMGAIPAFYSLPPGVYASAADLNLRGCTFMGTVLVSLSVWNWTQQHGWCYDYKWSDLSLWDVTSTCVAPYTVTGWWFAAIIGMVTVGVTFYFQRGWMASTPPATERSQVAMASAAPQPGPGDEEEATTLIRPPSKDKDAAGPSEAPFVADASKPVEIWSRRSMSLIAVASIVIGIGQAVGNNYYFISASLHSYKLFGQSWLGSGDILKIPTRFTTYAASFTVSKLVASVYAGVAWDHAPAGSRRRDSILRNVPLTLALSQAVLGFGPLLTNDNSILIFGLVTSGWATGAMTTLVPILVLEWFGRDRFMRMFSTLMTGSAVVMTFCFNGVMTLDWDVNHLDDDKSWFRYTNTPWRVNVTSADWDDFETHWGGCPHHPACFRASFYVQLAMALGALAVTHRMGAATRGSGGGGTKVIERD